MTRYDGGFQRDWHEAIDLYKEEAPSAPQVPALALCQHMRVSGVQDAYPDAGGP